MSTELWILAATAVVAVVAIGAALVAVRAVRRLDAARGAPEPIRPATPPVSEPAVQQVTDLVVLDAHDTPAPRIVEGRLVVPPSQQQVVQTALGRPGVRLSVFVHGAAHALRAESRDRITALMRREFRRRRRERLQAGRRAVRASRPAPPAPADEWLSS